jgi:hypothetical protein
MTRAEHMVWAKARAIEYIDAGDPVQAASSLISDLVKHDETRALGNDIARSGKAVQLAVEGNKAAMRDWIRRLI